MTRSSRLDPMRDQLAEWARQGKDSRTIAKLLKERGVDITHQAVSNYTKKLMAPTIAKVAERAKVQLDTLEQAVVEALSKYAALCAKSEAEMTIGERNYFRTVGEWFDRIARLRGLYAPQNVVQVAQQVNVEVKTLDVLNKWLDEKEALETNK